MYHREKSPDDNRGDAVKYTQISKYPVCCCLFDSDPMLATFDRMSPRVPWAETYVNLQCNGRFYAKLTQRPRLGSNRQGSDHKTP